MNKPLNIAHRGFSGSYPENTMLAFRKAKEAGCDGFETDMHLTKDGYPVICHDEKIDRTTNGTGFIKDYTFAELREFDAGIKRDKAFIGEKLPGIDEFFDLIKDSDLIVNIELKNDLFEYPDLEKIVFQKIYEYKLKDRIIISSFNHYSIKRCIDLDPGIRTGLLYSNRIYKPGKYAKQMGATAIHPNFRAFGKREAQDAFDEKIRINAWTINEVGDMKQMRDLGIDGIITNYPNRLRKLLEK